MNEFKGGLKFIHGFNGVLTTLWYLENLYSFTVLLGVLTILATLWYLEDLNSFMVLLGF
jgi:hypothetical protein